MNTRRAGAAVILSLAWVFADGFFARPIYPALVVAILAGVAWGLLGSGGDRGDRAGGLCAAAATVAAHGGMQPWLPDLLARWHLVPAGGSLAAAVLGPIGVALGTDPEGRVLVNGANGPVACAVTWELAAAPTVLRLIVATAIMGGLKSLPRGAALIAGFAATRVLLLIALQGGGAGAGIAHAPWVTLLTFLPLAHILASPDRALSARDRPARGDLSRGWRTACVALALAGSCLGWRAGYREAGPAGGGRVLIDESRSDWEWTDIPFDQERYGQRSLYNYALWKSWIELHHPTTVTRKVAGDRDLEDTDVLIIKTPTTPYDAESIRAIERFVRRGGGLFLIGDHTNLFGMSTVLNGIASPYDLRFEFDDTFPLDHREPDLFRPPWPAPHPVLRNIAAYPFETSCTLRVPWWAEIPMIGRRLGADMVDYGHVNFFGNMRLDPSERFGLFAQAALLSHGRGRVAAFTDSTNFSNFSMLWPGRRELTLNILDWLNRTEPPWGRLRLAVLACGLAAGAIGTLLLARAGGLARAAALWGGVCCFLLASRGAWSLTAPSWEAPVARAAYREAAFDTSLSKPGLDPISPIVRLAGPSWDAFNALYINAARSGTWPVVTDDLPAALQAHDVAVLVNPVRRPSVREARALASFVQRGGRLLVLDSILNRASSAAQILGPFGIGPEETVAPLREASRAATPAIAVRVPPGTSRRALSGGAVMVWRPVGKGRAALVTDAALLSDRALGGVYVTADKRRMEVYKGHAEMLRLLLEPQAGASRD